MVFTGPDYPQRNTGAEPPEAVLATRPGRPWPTQTAWVIPMIPTYTTPVVLPKLCLAFDWPTQMKIPRTAPGSPYNGYGWKPLLGKRGYDVGS